MAWREKLVWLAGKQINCYKAFNWVGLKSKLSHCLGPWSVLKLLRKFWERLEKVEARLG